MDFSIPWTLLGDGTIKELGSKLNEHHARKVCSPFVVDGDKWRKNIWEAHQRTETKKKQIAEREAIRSSLGLSPQNQHQRVPCKSCGKKKVGEVLPKEESK